MFAYRRDPSACVRELHAPQVLKHCPWKACSKPSPCCGHIQNGTWSTFQGNYYSINKIQNYIKYSMWWLSNEHATILEMSPCNWVVFLRSLRATLQRTISAPTNWHPWVQARDLWHPASWISVLSIFKTVCSKCQMWRVAVSGWGKNETMRDLEQNLWEPKRDLEALYSTLLFPTLLFSTLLLWNVRNTEVSLVNFLRTVKNLPANKIALSKIPPFLPSNF